MKGAANYGGNNLFFADFWNNTSVQVTVAISYIQTVAYLFAQNQDMSGFIGIQYDLIILYLFWKKKLQIRATLIPQPI